MVETKRTEKLDRRGFIDKVLARVTSRKLLVWASSLGLLLSGKLESEHYIWISLIYLGSQGMVDFVVSMKKADK